MASGGDSQNSGQSGVADISKILSAFKDSSGSTIVRIGQAGGINEGSTVAATMGGQTTLGEGTKYLEAAQTGGINRGDGKVAATMNHSLVTSPVAADERCESSGWVQGLKHDVGQLTFGAGKTAALLLSGAGESSDIFRNDLEKMKTLLTSEKIGLSEDLLVSVRPKPGSKQTTKAQAERAIDDLKAELIDSADNNFIFYYSGHFSKSHMFTIDSRDDPLLNYYNDKDLADLLRRIPAKYVLLILDMCYSGRADVGAKDGDGLPETRGVGDEEESAEVPQLWEFMTSGKDLQAKGDSEMVVQWSSSLADEPTYYLQSSLFTQAIVEVVTGLDTNDEVKTELEPGETHATVLQVHKHVVQRVEAALKKYKEVQRPVIKPDHADTGYFKRFPAFAKVK